MALFFVFVPILSLAMIPPITINGLGIREGLGILLFGLANSFPLLLVSYVFWAVSGSFRSGAEQAFLYETLRASGREGEYQKVLGRARAIFFAASILATAVGPPLAGATSLAVITEFRW